MTEGLHSAGFKTKIAFEIDDTISKAYMLNHKNTKVIINDIRNINTNEVIKYLGHETIHLLAGCPPCQGFSSIRRLNKTKPVQDERNELINEFVRFVVELKPYTFMMENVPGLALDESFKNAINEIEKAGYFKPDWKIVNLKDYGIPQNRKRLVLIGSRLAPIKIAESTHERKTVRQVIGMLPPPEKSNDPLHRVFPKHSERISNLIKDIPKNGGSRKDLGKDRQLKCHQKKNIGFNDVYGRLKWDSYATTITGGCLNPSKGRFLHPDQDRCISAREAAMLQSFPQSYIFPTDAPITKIALMIGNALPPEFCKVQADNIKLHILTHLNKE